MKYFSGFCLCGEKELFKEYIEDKEFVVAGFSKGAQEALDYILNTDKRVDKLQLLSPAFFEYNEKIIELNLEAFKKDKEKYIKNFLKKAGIPDMKYICNCNLEELKKLFTFKWEKIKRVKGIKIEIFLGEYDKISASKKACEFFKQYGDVYFIKKANHFLRS
ncbi:MAG: pimelyl-ACP methyl ester esterase BioV [Nautiliaceae bacterium]